MESKKFANFWFGADLAFVLAWNIETEFQISNIMIPSLIWTLCSNLVNQPVKQALNSACKYWRNNEVTLFLFWLF